MRQIALKVAQDFLVKNNATAEAAAKALIEKLFEQGNAKFDFLVPNHLISLEEGVRSIRVGRVRAMLTDDFDAELAETSDSKVRIVTDQGFSIEFVASALTPDVGFCPGTTIDISLRTDTLEVLPDEREELQW